MKPLALSLAEISWLALLAGLGFAPLGAEPTALWLASGLAALALLPWPGAGLAAGRLRPDRLLSLLGLFVALSRVGMDPAGGLAGVWPLIPAAGLFAAGLALAWCGGLARRTEILWAVCVGLLAVGLVAGAAQLILAWRSTADMQAGDMFFLGPLVVYATCWFGLDAWLRSLPRERPAGVWAWLVDRRPALCLALLLAGLWIRTWLS